MLSKFNAFLKAEDFHNRCKALKLPDYHQNQILRASSSLALNLAEGSGKRTIADRKKYFTSALGSLRECEAILRLERIKDPELLTCMDQLGALVYTLSRR